MNFCPFALVLRAYAAAATKQKQGHACAAQKRGKQMNGHVIIMVIIEALAKSIKYKQVKLIFMYL